MSKDVTKQGMDGYQRILDNLATAVLELDEGLRVTYLNSAAESLLCHSARQLAGSPAAEVLGSHSELLDALQRGVEDGQQFTKREIELYLPSHRHALQVDCTITPSLTHTGQPGVLLEIKRIDRMLRIAREEGLIAQQHAMKLLVRGLAHEVKNPLGGLRGAAQLLERELPDASLKEYTQVIIGEADRLQKLVDDMLGPNRQSQKEPVNIHEVLEHVRQLVKVGSGDGLHIHRDYDPSIPDITADRNQLVQVVLNIVRNAKEALHDEGNITLRTRALRQFTIGQRRHRLVLRVDISDDGPGIPPEIVNQIFYPMVTGKADGTGLGLSIAQTLIGLHGGLVECKSQPGSTTFSILLPINGED